ncbi:COP9/signalosome complex subunit Csn2 [Schizosaccharomyces cryophilus OY26]|uniref:COP9 signalosome complex subunit 2 n=1 Tax=Schizosaccharomyces cryophilus (strain OY26 / ATCC MYA-4695 / CBS 11777 / NBRC 106824 / NRRL Y48691) TaxID=653667 RepID=S9XAX7_SCHCR|nr:COP9/signalosome complex subunit Csn2 [Schizosaccharomyces cryophilus OY26]EPY50886.1 COP9/signalosome complex subunit Csn2 [Schizosaccharomyces cryophilus OY26]
MADDFMLEDDEDYEFEFEDDDDEMVEPDVDIENSYYNSKALKEDDAGAAVRSFLEIVDKCKSEKDEWAFKSLKQVLKIVFRTDQLDEMLKHYQKLLEFAEWPSITKNYAEKSIYNIVDYASSSTNAQFLERFYEITTHALHKLNNERLTLKTLMHVARFFLSQKNYVKFKSLLRQMHLLLSNENTAVTDQNRETHLLELYSLEIQMYSSLEDNKRLKELYQSSLRIKTAIPHPKIMGIIRECGGKMHMQEEQWSEAQTNFFESFKCYDEAGSMDRIRVLKYLVLSNMLCESEINPYDSPETQPYKENPHVFAMTKLVEAYQKRDIKEVEKVLHEHRQDIMEDEFIRQYVDKILYSIRSQVLLEMIQPYSTVQLSLLAEKLAVTTEIVEQSLIGLIMDRRIQGKLDMIHEIYVKQSPLTILSDELTKNTQKLWSDIAKN